MENETRIEQFKKMAEADPDNELGHFSLGKAYLDAEQYAPAEKAFERVLQLNPTHSKTYQLLGQTRLRLDRREKAVEALQRGYEVASECGDVMPRDAIAALLTELDVELPSVAQTTAAPRPAAETGTADAGDFRCSRCGRPSGKLTERPFKGKLGEKIFANVCETCWTEWIGMGTKVINEMGLQLADPKSQTAYDEQMVEFLQITD